MTECVDVHSEIHRPHLAFLTLWCGSGMGLREGQIMLTVFQPLENTCLLMFCGFTPWV